MTKLWHLIIGHRWHDVDMTHIGCRCGARRGREDWG